MEKPERNNVSPKIYKFPEKSRFFSQNHGWNCISKIKNSEELEKN